MTKLCQSPITLDLLQGAIEAIITSYSLKIRNAGYNQAVDDAFIERSKQNAWRRFSEEGEPYSTLIEAAGLFSETPAAQPQQADEEVVSPNIGNNL